MKTSPQTRTPRHTLATASLIENFQAKLLRGDVDAALRERVSKMSASDIAAMEQEHIRTCRLVENENGPSTGDETDLFLTGMKGFVEDHRVASEKAVQARKMLGDLRAKMVEKQGQLEEVIARRDEVARLPSGGQEAREEAKALDCDVKAKMRELRDLAAEADARRQEWEMSISEVEGTNGDMAMGLSQLIGHLRGERME